ncbi:MAG: hypothetical protein O7A67_04840 [SAR324 cluster bacterium]|nr:hypothetical protein [SAR324 cluster bacterium]
MELQHCNAKVFLSAGAELDLEGCLSIFHDWIRQQNGEELLVDVADYRHVRGGPELILIGHEGDYYLEREDGALGLRYSRKAALEGDNAGRIRQAFRAVLTACRRLDRDSALTGGVSARGDGLEFMVNDRLLAPNTPETFAEVQPDLEAALAEPLGEGNFFLTPAGESRGRFTVKIAVQTPFNAAELLERLN